MNYSALDELKRMVLDPDLNVRSGVYTAIDPTLKMSMSERGEYEYLGLDDQYGGPASELLAVSAFGVSPSKENEIAARLFGSDDQASFHPVLGHYQGLYAGFALEDSFRLEGSSGGLATWMLVELLKTNRIDGVIHLVPTFDPNNLFSYRISRTESDIRAGSKSRYYPAHLSDVLNTVNVEGGRYALTAIPSFAYEVRLLQAQIPEFAKRIPYIFGLVCGHQKTANYAKQLAWRAGLEMNDVTYIDFRRKDLGQPANRYTTEFHSYVEGQTVVSVAQQESLFGTDWGLGLFKSNFSDFTEDAFNETADIVFGDAWLDEYVQDSGGTNIVITRNVELHNLLLEAHHHGRVSLDKLGSEKVLSSQGSLVRQNVEEFPARFDHVKRAGGYVPQSRRSGLPKLSFRRRLIQRERLRISRASHEAWIAARNANSLRVFDEELEPFVRRYKWARRISNIQVLVRDFSRRLKRKFAAIATRK